MSAPLGAWRDSVEITIGGGERGPWRQHESRYDFGDDPRVAIDDRGDVALACVDQAREDVLFPRVAVASCSSITSRGVLA